MRQLSYNKKVCSFKPVERLNMSMKQEFAFMIILSAQHIAKSFGVNAVLRDVSLTVQQGDRIGLVGVNGCGKSTLMRILAGLDAQDGGEISLVRGLRVGYLAQQNMVTSGETVWNELQKVYEQVFAMEKKLRELEDEMAHAHTDAQRFAQLSADYDRLTQRFEEADGYSWKSMVSGVLNGLGFKPAQYDQCVDSLSGGEQTRLCLARLLLQKPDLLLLDEPTNHLDMETLQWLENYLAAYKGSVLVISHDRYFLDHVCTGIVEILMGSSEQYNGNYTRYIAQRQERFESRMRAYEIQQKEIERQQAIIARYRMFNREKSIRAAESREKALDRMEKLEKPVDERAIRFSFEARRRTGEDVLQLTEISKSFGEKHLFHDLTLRVRAGDRVALIGPNGVGKSTLLNTLAPALHRETGQISQKLGRGRHTTREVEIFEICGGRLADTPGFASLEAQKLCRIPKDDLQHTFPEFGPYFGQCRFTGCSHRSETGCAVREAVEAGTISKTRYASYLAMYEEASARKEWEK